MNPEGAPMRSVIDQLCRGHLPAAERALTHALLATKQGANPCAALRQSAKILRAAHWVSAMRFNDALLGAWSQVQSNQSHNESSTLLSLEAFQAAISDFLEAIKNVPVRELAWSSNLIEHYSALCACKSKSVALFVEECAGAGRIFPPAVFRTSRTDAQAIARVTPLRARYERALLALLNTSNEEAPCDNVLQDDLKACLSEGLAPEGESLQTYDIGRLLEAWIQVQHAVCEVSDSLPDSLGQVFNAHTRRVYALLNPLWIMKMLNPSPNIDSMNGEQNERVFVVPPACVRALVISLWGMFLTYRTQLQATQASVQAITELLLDYGISISINETDSSAHNDAPFEALAWWERIGRNESKRLGVLELSQDAYENFQVQMHSIESMVSGLLRTIGTTQDIPANALLVCDEIGSLADLAYMVGLGDLAFLTEQLATAWRYHAFWLFQMRANRLIQAVVETYDSAKEMHSTFTEQTGTQDALSIQKSAIDTAQTTLIELTHILLQELKILGAGDIPKHLTRAHQQALITLIGCRYEETVS